MNVVDIHLTDYRRVQVRNKPGRLGACFCLGFFEDKRLDRWMVSG
jgi:hypothetical protein